MVREIKHSDMSGFDCAPRLPMRRGEVVEAQQQQQQQQQHSIEHQSMTNDSMRVLMDCMKESALTGFDCAPRLPMRRGEVMEEEQQQQQQQQQQSIEHQSIINNSMRVLMVSMKQSVMSRKLIKQFPIPFSRKKLTCGLSTSSSSSSTSTCSSTKKPVVKAKRYSNQHEKCNTKKQLSVMKRINPFSTSPTTLDSHIPSEITIISPATRSSNYVPTISPKLSSNDESTFCFTETDLDSVLLDSYIPPAIEAHDDYSISRSFDDDQHIIGCL